MQPIRRKRGRPPKPEHEKVRPPPKIRKRKPASETKIGKIRAAAMATADEEIGFDPTDTGGRPTKFRDEFVRIAKAMCRLGATDADLAEEFGVDLVTIYNWQSKHPRFAKAIALGKLPADDRVERAFYMRATGYAAPATKIMQHEGRPIIVPYQQHIPPDPGAAFNWLVNRRSDEWRSRHSLEHTGNGKTLGQELAGGDPRALLETARWISERLAAAQQPEPIDITPQLISGPTNGNADHS